MYYVVKNYKNEFYVVVKTWLQTIKGNVFAFYPPTEAQTNKALACLSTPGLDWTNEEVKIVSNQFLKYADAVSEMNKKLKFYDSAAEEEFEKKKSHARLHPVGNKSRGRSFNLAFEDESPAVKVQKISSVDANDYITDEVSESKVQEKINDLFPQEETNKISIEKPNTETLLSQLVTVDNITDVRSNESHVMIPISIWDEMLSQIKEINIKINENASKTDENFISIVNELKDLRIGLNINKNNIQMSFEKPKKISTQLELNEKEKSLDDFNQRDSYLKLVSDMARCLQKPSKSNSSEHGLVKSFMELYFDSEFLKEMGWTNVKGRLSFETYRMHHKLIFEACNIHTPNLFPNVDAATKSIINFFKRLHETKKSKNNFDSDPLLKEK